MTLSSRIELEREALRIRYGIVRALASNGGGHMGGSLDLADMLAVVYTDFMRVDPGDPGREDRDFMIFSKGHAGPALYAALCSRGFFSADRLDKLNHPSSELPGHCDRMHVPGVDATTGSLGQGLSIACGVALAAKLRGTDQRVFCVTGDGESAEGQIWEAAQFAAHHRLGNLIAFLDWNKKQIDGTLDEVMRLGDAVEKYRAFGWRAACVKGDDVLAVQKAVRDALERQDTPSMIVLDTVKGHGIECVSSLGNNHCGPFTEAMREEALQELAARAAKLGMEAD